MSDGSVYRRLLRIEPLENRRMLTNVTVSNLFDTVNGNTGSIAFLNANNGGDGISLREAIMAANANVDADIINFSVNGTINLSNRPDPELDHLLISKNLTINGPGSSLLTIRAYDPNVGTIGDGRRVFEINNGLATLINVTINDVTITGGDLDEDGAGAGIWNRGETLTINRSVISNNRTQQTGGGIASSSSGTVTINNSTISGNSAGSDASLQGGGIYATSPIDGTPGSLVIASSTVSGNSAGSGAGISTLVPTTITSSNINTNTAEYYGGGIWADDNVSITGSTISGNSAAAGGGGVRQYSGTLTMIGTTVSNNTATADYSFGGGIYGDTVNVTLSTISGNSAKGGGGGFYGNNTNISYSTVSGNSVTGLYSSGGGLLGGGVITSSTVSGNSSAGIGGGVSGNFDIINSTVSGNTATIAGGGVYRSDFDTIVIRHSTISGNTAPPGAGSGIASPAYIAGYEVQIQSSIVAGNTNSDIDLVNGTEATIESLGYNLVGSGSGNTAFGIPSGDKVGLNPLLGPLANNGGSTQTRALLAGSPAIDAGNPSAAPGSGTVPQFDQRNAPNIRVRGARIDIGAFESTPIVPALLGDYNRDSSVNAADYVFWRKTLSTPDLVAYAGADGSGNGLIDQPDYGVWTQNFGEPGSGGGSSEGEVEALVGQAAPDVSASSLVLQQVSLDLHAGKPSYAPESVGVSSQSTAQSLADMFWLTLPAHPESQSDGDAEAWLNATTLDDAQSGDDIGALDAVFDLF